MIKIFVDGDRFPVSIGSQAMMICTMRILKEYIPIAKINILSFYPEFDHKLYGNYKFDLNIVKYNKSFFRSIFDILNESKKADIIVGVYGDAFVGKNFFTNIKFLFKLLIVTSTGKPVILFPLSVGPFNSILIKLFVRMIFNRMRSISVRDEISTSFLHEAGVKKPPIYLTADTAFILEPVHNKRMEQILSKEGINEKPLVGLNVSQLLNYKSNEKNLVPSYIDLMTNIADYIVSNIDATVILIPHEISFAGVELVGDVKNLGGDDITAIKDVFAKVKNKQRVIPIITKYNSEELKGIIGMCDVFIGARTHSTIASTTMYVPTIAIGYSHKAYGIMRMVGLEKYVCNFENMNLEELKSNIDDIWIHKEEIRSALTSKIGILKESAWSNGKLVKEILKKEGHYKIE